MPLHVFWDNDEKTIIRCESEGKWTWVEYHHALEQMVEMVNSVSHQVNLINGERPGAVMPPGSPLPHFRHTAKILPANVGLNVVIVKSALARIMASAYAKMPGNSMDRVKLANGLEEAYDLIHAREPMKY